MFIFHSHEQSTNHNNYQRYMGMPMT